MFCKFLTKLLRIGKFRKLYLILRNQNAGNVVKTAYTKSITYNH